MEKAIRFIFGLLYILLLSSCAVLLVIFALALYAPGGGMVAQILEIDSKQATLEFIGWCLGGMLTAIGAVEFSRNRRAAMAMKNAETMTKNAEAMAKNNVLTEKGHIEERFKTAVQHLDSGSPSARIASFYQLYQLAKDNPAPDSVKNIHEILCAHLRQTTRDGKYQKHYATCPSEECQSLLDVLFRNSENLFMEMKANLRGVYIVGADMQSAKGLVDFANAEARYVNFHCADLPKASFYDANLQGSSFESAELTDASFFGADLTDVDFKRANLAGASAIAARNCPPNTFMP